MFHYLTLWQKFDHKLRMTTNIYNYAPHKSNQCFSCCSLLFQSSQKEIQRLRDREVRLTSDLTNTVQELNRLKVVVLDVSPEANVWRHCTKLVSYNEWSTVSKQLRCTDEHSLWEDSVACWNEIIESSQYQQRTDWSSQNKVLVEKWHKHIAFIT